MLTPGLSQGRRREGAPAVGITSSLLLVFDLLGRLDDPSRLGPRIAHAAVLAITGSFVGFVAAAVGDRRPLAAGA